MNEADIEFFTVAGIVNMIVRHKMLVGHAPTWTARDGQAFVAIRATLREHAANPFHTDEIAIEDAPGATDAPVSQATSAAIVELRDAA